MTSAFSFPPIRAAASAHLLPPCMFHDAILIGFSSRTSGKPRDPNPTRPLSRAQDGPNAHACVGTFERAGANLHVRGEVRNTRPAGSMRVIPPHRARRSGELVPPDHRVERAR